MKLNDELAEAIVRLQNNPDFQKFDDHLKAYRHELFEFVMYAPAADAETYRGMARAVTEVLRGLSGAREHLKKRLARR